MLAKIIDVYILYKHPTSLSPLRPLSLSDNYQSHPMEDDATFQTVLFKTQVKQSFPKIPHYQHSRNTKHQISKILKTTISGKALQSLTSCQLSLQQFEVRYLGFNFGSITSTFTFYLMQKSSTCLTQTMKKQFHFRNQPLYTKHFSYWKPFTWTHLSQTQPT